MYEFSFEMSAIELKYIVALDNWGSLKKILEYLKVGRLNVSLIWKFISK